MATRFGGTQVPQYASPAGGMRPGFMRLPSNGGPPAGAVTMQPNSTGGQGYGGGPGPGPNQQRQQANGNGPAGGAGQRRPERKDTKETAWVHWRALKDFLTEWGDKESPTARASAREKLTRLTRLQFLELSTDVYDELMRRKAVNLPDAMPFLPVRDDFHPKRNQARQKLATLPKNRFKDLASDVFFELHRRYPEFEDGDNGATSPVKEKQDNGRNSGYDGQSGPAPGQQQQQQQQRPTHHQKGSSMGSSTERSVTTPVNTQATRDRYANLTTATSDVVVPNKSRLQEEAIEVPYARDSQDMDAGPSESLQTAGGAGPSGLREGFRPDSRSSHGGPSSNSHDVRSPSLTEQSHYLDRMSVASNSAAPVTTQQTKSAVAGVMSSNDWNDMEEKLRSEYELRIAGLERRVHAAESEHDDTKRQLQEERERRKDYEDEVRGLKERATTHASSLRSIQHELDVAKDETESLRKQSEQTSRQAQEEITQWRERCEDLEDELHRLEGERTDRSGPEAVAPAPNAGGASDQMVDELRSEVRSLVEELKSVSLQNDELMAERDRDRDAQAALEDKVEEYKKMANAARVELRNLKATSTLFVSKPLSNDHLPASPDGNIDDIHVAEFQAAIDELLTTTRSSKPTQVLPCMKAVVEAVTHIGDDVKTFQESPNFDVDVSRLEMLKHESTTRLSALMTEARNHAMASGLSPLSLMDAAASHLSVNVVEIIKLLKIRRSGSTQEIMMGKQGGGMRIGDMVRRKSGIYGQQSPVPEEEEEHEQLRDDTPPAVDRRPSQEGYRAGSASSFHRALDNSTSTAGYNRSGDDSYSRGHPDDHRGVGYGASGAYGGGYKQTGSASSPLRGGNLAAAHPPSAYDNGGLPEFRIKSFQSASSTAQRSDAFDLERKGSSASARSDYEPPHRRGQAVASAHDPYSEPYGRSSSAAAGTANASVHGGSHSPENQRRGVGHSRGPSLLSPTSPDARSAAPPYQNTSYGNKAAPQQQQQQQSARQGGSDQEWKDLQPYLNTQSPMLVGAIQNLLTDIRTGGQGPTLNDHLSEVIAISSSIVGVCRSSLPQSLRARGEPHLKDLVDNTDRLSDAQATAAHAGGFDKELRTKIASASFGVAKGLKALMKVGGMNEQQQ